MPEPGRRSLVTNTTPLIALTAATGGAALLRFLFEPAGMRVVQGMLR